MIKNKNDLLIVVIEDLLQLEEYIEDTYTYSECIKDNDLINVGKVLNSCIFKLSTLNLEIDFENDIKYENYYLKTIVLESAKDNE